MVVVNPILKKSSRKSLNSSAALLGLAAGAVGWSGLAQAASEETASQILLLPEYYELRENGVAVFKLETGENLRLTADQYLILEDGLLLITDDLAQASISSLPVMGSVRAGLLSELQPVRTFDGSVVKAQANEPVWSGEGLAPRLSEQVAFERFELAQSQSQAEAQEEDSSDGDDDDVVAALPGFSGGAAVLAFFGMLIASRQPGSATEVAPAPEAAPSYNSYAFRLDGVDPDDYSGFSVSSAGDVDGDGKDDILIGAPYAGSNKGEVYLVFGSYLAENRGTVADLSDLSGGKGVRLDGIDTDDYAGYSVSSAGDVDGDGKDDVLIGAWGGDPDGAEEAGETYLVFGSHLATKPTTVDLNALSGGKGVRLEGIDGSDYSGEFVSAAGDVDADGKGDILIGAYSAYSARGEVYLVLGSHLATAETVDLGDLSGGKGILILGIDEDDVAGRVSSAGDVDGDGKDDILIGAPGADPEDEFDIGETYLISGHTLDLAIDGIGVANAGVIDLAADFGFG